DVVGGAARATHRLHLSLLGAGVQSQMIVRTSHAPGATVRAYWSSQRFGDRLKRFFQRRRFLALDGAITRRRSPGVEQFNTDRGPFGLELARRLPACDLLHVHWCSGFVDLPSFLPAALQRTPVVVTLHDVFGLTGGCHYAQGCERWRTGCGRCPQLGRDAQESLTAPSWARKQAAYRAPGPLQLVAASRWTQRQAGESPLTAHLPCRTIPFGIDGQVFSPRNRTTARELFGLPTGAEIVLFAADATDNPRKGFDVLAAAVARLHDRRDLVLVSVGRGRPKLPDQIRHVHLGVFSDDRFLSLVYSAADVFVIPSREEAFGQTTLEAFACGVPVLGSDVGGIPDLVRPGVTGLLAESGNSAAFSTALATLLDGAADRAAMGARARRVAVDEFSFDRCAQSHLTLYREMLA
ncbi:MAG: hypothetical protein RIQ93_3088, partial [Verrucomicrobiota bacterium]